MLLIEKIRSSLLRRTIDTENKVLFAERSELSKVPSFLPGMGQKVVSPTSPTELCLVH